MRRRVGGYPCSALQGERNEPDASGAATRLRHLLFEWPALTLSRVPGCEPGTSQSGLLAGRGVPWVPTAPAEAVTAVHEAAPTWKALLKRLRRRSFAERRGRTHNVLLRTASVSQSRRTLEGGPRGEPPRHPSDPWPQGARRPLRTTRQGESSTGENPVLPLRVRSPDPNEGFAQGEVPEEPPGGPVPVRRQAAGQGPESLLQTDFAVAFGRSLMRPLRRSG